MKYGLLVTSCKKNDGNFICLVRGLESILSPDGNPITNENSCPLLLLSRNIFATKPNNIHRAVSIIVHECGEECTFVNMDTFRNVERESIFMSINMTMPQILCTVLISFVYEHKQ